MTNEVRRPITEAKPGDKLRWTRLYPGMTGRLIELIGEGDFLICKMVTANHPECCEFAKNLELMEPGDPGYDMDLACPQRELQ